jgi:hypothetical protein
MTIWGNSKMTTLYYSDDSAALDYPCVVKIDDKHVIVEYEDDGAKQYCGPNNGTDHFELKATDGDGHASLHRFPDSIILEGSWKEGGVRGMWKIKLEKN